MWDVKAKGYGVKPHIRPYTRGQFILQTNNPESYAGLDDGYSAAAIGIYDYATKVLRIDAQGLVAVSGSLSAVVEVEEPLERLQREVKVLQSRYDALEALVRSVLGEF